VAQGVLRNKPLLPREVNMHCTPDSKAIEALGERIAEQIKGITHRLGGASGETERTLAWWNRK
jgi:hypothetical protein